jgi:phage-related minor tail protein
MSNLREMTVGIILRDEATRELTQINRTMDDIRDNFNLMNRDIRTTERGLTNLGEDGERSILLIESGLESATGSMDEFGDDSRDTLRSLQRQVSRLESELEGMNQTTEDSGDTANKASGMFSKLGKIGAGTAGVIAAGFTAATATITAMMTASEETFDRLQARTGHTAKQLDALKGASKDVFVNGFGEDMAHVTEEVGNLANIIGDFTEEGMSYLAKGAFTISELWGPEVKEVGKTIKTMTATFDGLKQKDAMDLMTTAFQRTGDYSDDLLDTFNEYSVYFEKLGFDAEGFTNILVKGAEAGAFTMDKAADAIKEFGIRSIDASESTADGFKAIGLDAELMTKNFAAGGETSQQAFAATIAGLASMKDSVKQNAAGVSLFGTQWEDLREDVILSMSDGESAIQGFEGATERAAETMHGNFSSKMKKAFRTLKTEISSAFTENGGGEFLEKLGTGIDYLVPKIASFVGSAIKGIKQFISYFQTFMTKIKESETIQNIFSFVSGAISSFVNEFVIPLMPKAQEFITNAFNNIKPVIGVIIGLFKSVWGVIQTLVNKVVIPLFPVFKDIISTAFNIISPIIRIASGLIQAVGGTIMFLVNNVVKPLIPLIAPIFKGMWDFVKPILDYMVDVFNSIADAIDWAIDKVKKFASTMSNVKIGIPKWLGGNGFIQQKDGSHATGLARVPVNGYMAELHKDESVLTAKQSDALRQAGMLKSNNGKPLLDFSANSRPSASSNSISVGNIEIHVTETANSKKTAMDIRAELEDYFGSLMRRAPQVTEG